MVRACARNSSSDSVSASASASRAVSSASLVLSREHLKAGREAEDTRFRRGCGASRDERTRRGDPCVGIVAASLVPGSDRKEGLALGSRLDVSGLENRVSSFLERRPTALVSRDVKRSRASKEQVGSLGIVLGPQLERFVVVALGRRKRVEGERAVAGFSEREPCTVCELGAVSAGGPSELEGRAPVMSQHLGVVIGSAEAFDPLGDLGVLVRAVGACNLPVGDVTDERVREGDLGLIFDGSAPLAANEALALERMQRRRRGTLLATERADPEHLSDDRCIAEKIFLVRRESVETGGDDALERLRQRKLLRRASLEVELRELLGVERVSTCSLEQGPLRLRHEHRAFQEATYQVCGLLVRQRGDGERRGVQLAAAPAGSTFEELGPRRRDHEQRHVRYPLDELVDEVEEALVRPVQILEDENERAAFGHRLEEEAPSGKRLASAIAAELALGAQTDEREQVRLDPRYVGRVVEQVRDGRTDFLGRFRRRILLVDPGLRLDDLAECPHRDTVPVGETATLAPGDEVGVGIDHPAKLVDEAALADAGHSDECHEL